MCHSLQTYCCCTHY
ncbi:hypothetical protein [Acinetobacter pittii]